MRGKRKRKPVQVLGPTPERMAKDDWDKVSTERAGIEGKRVSLPNPYDLYFRQGKLSRDEFMACQYFHTQYTAAYGAECRIARYDKGPGTGYGHGQQHALVAIRQLAQKMGHRYLWLELAIAEGVGMRVLERRMGVRNGRGMSMLREAIMMMTIIWGMTNEAETSHESKVDTGTNKRDSAGK